jgi:hypothetical protein
MTNLFLSFLFTIHLGWNNNIDGITEGYNVYHGTSYALVYPSKFELVNIGCDNEAFFDVAPNQYDWFFVTAYNRDGAESDKGTPQIFVIHPR